jgi:predicted MFS family arabinose efflux permease
MAMNLGSFFSSFGLGVIVGPMIGGFVLARTGRPNTVYFARAAIAGVELVPVIIMSWRR